MPASIGFDAAVEFAPNSGLSPSLPMRLRRLPRIGRLLRTHGHTIYSYDALVARMADRPAPGYRRFRGVTPAWDNSSRRTRGATIYHGATPEKYQAWLTTALRHTVATCEGDERIVFVNAWNEWAEGNHLEPCQKWGHRYLEATADALATVSASSGDVASRGEASSEVTPTPTSA